MSPRLILGAKKRRYCFADDNRTTDLRTFLNFILSSSFICTKSKYLKEWEHLEIKLYKGGHLN